MKSALTRLAAALWLLLAPTLPRALADDGRLVIEGFLLVLVALLLPERARERGGVLGALAGLWTLLLAFELGMAGGRYTTQEDPVLYDGAQLLWHLGVLLIDLYGFLAVGCGVVLVLGCVGASGWIALQALRNLGRWKAGDVGALAVLGLLGAGWWTLTPLSSTVLAADRARESVALHHRIRAYTRTEGYAPHRAVKLERRPDVRIYVVESYGMAAFREPAMQGWPERVRALEDRMLAAGWWTASVRSIAPTQGGRSWICDAAFLFGRPVRYQAEYQALTARAAELDHLPAWFASQGYRTILSRPSDRERPGVKLANYFGFQQTYFYDDLEYRGEPVGWGQIPDQYTVGWLHANPFAGEGPQFSFVHLATAHFPWRPAPERLGDWREYNTRTDPLPPRANRETATELWWVANQFRRSEYKLNRHVPPQRVLNYLDLVEHGFDAIVHELTDLPPERPTLVLIFGDHQPPFISAPGRYDVPIHIAASDPALLDEFFSDEAVEGWVPGAGVTTHASWFSRLTRALARYDGEAPPPLLPEGVQ